MSHSLNSLKGVIQGTTIGDIKGDTRSLDNGSNDSKFCFMFGVMLQSCPCNCTSDMAFVLAVFH